MKSISSEDYLKAIYHLSKEKKGKIATSDIAKKLNVKPSSTTEMLHKLEVKKLVIRKKYYGVNLTGDGEKIAIMLVRRHRLWEVFLAKKLHFEWGEVHELAEELEHIGSEKLINRLDDFLGNPKFDPHGDPIPDASGKFDVQKTYLLSEVKIGTKIVIRRVKHSSTDFLEYLTKMNLLIGTELCLLERMPFDNSLKVSNNDLEIQLSEKVTNNLLVADLFSE